MFPLSVIRLQTVQRLNRTKTYNIENVDSSPMTVLATPIKKLNTELIHLA